MPQLVSVHGGHSGEFCNHAQDDLESIVRAYIEQGFAWVGVTEHIAPMNDNYLYPDEVAAGLTSTAMLERLERYFAQCRHLQVKYADQITLFAGMETDWYSGILPYLRQLLARFQPDYIVGSVHHLHDICFDLSPQIYQRLIQIAGGVESFYCDYFDAQYQMLRQLRPAVVGHFDYVRIWDEEYPIRWENPAIWTRIVRNLRFVRDAGLILDYNQKALRLGATEPYISAPILAEAIKMGIHIAPGDDAHSAAEAGQNMASAIKKLQAAGANTNWRMPATPP